MPKFSLIIPTYNRAYILWKTIQSVQSQALTDWELLIVDDGSTDDTKKLIREFQCDPRISYFAKNNGGASSARNIGLKHALGEIITYVDSDDQIFPDYLATAEKYFFTHPHKLYAHANCHRILEYYDEDGLLKGEKKSIAYETPPTLQDFYDWKLKPSIGTGFFHRNNIQPRWNESLKLLENLDFLMQLATYYPSGFFYIPEILYTYKQRYGGDGLCSTASYADWAHAFQTILNLHQNDPLMTHPNIYQAQVMKYQQIEKREPCPLN